jgi:hypothetical protein
MSSNNARARRDFGVAAALHLAGARAFVAATAAYDIFM